MEVEDSRVNYGDEFILTLQIYKYNTDRRFFTIISEIGNVASEYMIRLPLRGEGAVYIDWGDDSELQLINLDRERISGGLTKIYKFPGEYLVRIYSFTSEEVSFGNGKFPYQGSKYITGIMQWGDLDLVSLSGALAFTEDILHLPDDLPSSVKDLSFLFYRSNVSNIPQIQKWDVSSVINLKGAFQWTKYFNEDISRWDVSKVKDASYIVHEARSFEGDLSSWEVSREEEKNEKCTLT